MAQYKSKDIQLIQDALHSAEKSALVDKDSIHTLTIAASTKTNEISFGVIGSTENIIAMLHGFLSNNLDLIPIFITVLGKIVEDEDKVSDKAVKDLLDSLGFNTEGDEK